MSGDPYKELVRRYFVKPVHAGDLQETYPRRAEAAIHSADGVMAVELAAGVDDGTLCELRFRARGCPHLLAACEDFCRAYEGSETGALATFSVTESMRRLDVPVTKTGRILLLEDAVRLLQRKLTHNAR